MKAILNLYRPPTRYFVSFSKNKSEPLMWSHYADKHKGFCLIFKAINNELYQFPLQKKHSISRVTTRGIAPNMTHGMPESFSFSKINYEPTVNPTNAFFGLPVGIVGEDPDKEKTKRIAEERESHYTQKSKSWKYEDEYRLMLRPPLHYLFGEHFDFSKQERLFHYKPSQLVGIIYGARMNSEDKKRIKELLVERRNWYHQVVNYKRVEFNFVEFDAKLSVNQRNVDIVPTGILSYKTIGISDPNFDRLYKEWQEGWGHETEGGSAKRIKID